MLTSLAIASLSDIAARPMVRARDARNEEGAKQFSRGNSGLDGERKRIAARGESDLRPPCGLFLAVRRRAKHEQSQVRVGDGANLAARQYALSLSS